MSRDKLHEAHQLISALQDELVAYKAIVNQVLSVVLDEPKLEEDYSLPPPVEMMPSHLGEVHSLRLQQWWTKMAIDHDARKEAAERPQHGPGCPSSACWECGVCANCGRYVGAGE